MTEQLSFADALHRRDEALAVVEEHADREALEAWWQEFRAFCERHEFVFCDDFLNDALYVLKLPTLREPRAIGAIFKRAIFEGLIEKSGAYRPSVRSNLSPRPVWRSLIYVRGEKGREGCTSATR